jgi:hypothetical protein
LWADFSQSAWLGASRVGTAVGTGGGAGQTFSGQAWQAGQGVAGGGVLQAANPIATSTNNAPSTSSARIVCLGIFLFS